MIFLLGCVLQRVVVCYSVLQLVAVCYPELLQDNLPAGVCVAFILQCFVVWCIRWMLFFFSLSLQFHRRVFDLAVKTCMRSFRRIAERAGVGFVNS